MRDSIPGIVDKLVAVCAWLGALSVAAVFCWIVGDVVLRGLESVSWSFLFSRPESGGRAGGIAPILVSTFLILFICLLAALPISIGTAALLAEFTTRENGFALIVRRSLDVLAGVPSIVFGLFGNAFFCIFLGMRYSILAGGLTLACMVLPLLIRAAEEGFRAVSDDHRRAAAALGLSRSSIFFRIILPLAVPGLIVGLVLGIGRALAETAALLFTSGLVDRMPASLWDPGRSLSIHIYHLGMHVNGGDKNAYASALLLIVLLVVINVTVSLLTSRLLQRKVMVS